jgi:hypothetical protein
LLLRWLLRTLLLRFARLLLWLLRSRGSGGQGAGAAIATGAVFGLRRRRLTRHARMAARQLLRGQIGSLLLLKTQSGSGRGRAEPPPSAVLPRGRRAQFNARRRHRQSRR